MKIGPHDIQRDGDFAFIIAELGHNHGGDLGTAKTMVAAAATCGANAVKLQKRTNKKLYTAEFYNKPYNSEAAYGPTYGLHREALEFGLEEYGQLKADAERAGVVFFATPFDVDAADFLQELGVPAFKIASGDLTNVRLLRHAAKFGKPMLVSTGGGTLEDIRRALREIGDRAEVAILQCTAAYPCPPEAMNLRVIETYRKEFPDAVIGLSDHQSGIALGPAAYALGARIFEKHFTLDRAGKGTDHAFSLEPVGLRKYARDLRRTAVAMGTGDKQRLDIEGPPLYKMAKGLYAYRAIEEGEELGDWNIEAKSPAEGMAAWKWDKATGKRAIRPFGQDEPLSSGDLI